MIAELLLLQGLLDKSPMFTPNTEQPTTTSTSAYDDAITRIKKKAEQLKADLPTSYYRRLDRY